MLSRNFLFLFFNGDLRRNLPSEQNFKLYYRGLKFCSSLTVAKLPYKPFYPILIRVGSRLRQVRHIHKICLLCIYIQLKVGLIKIQHS